MEDRAEYITTKQVCELAKISRATFYRRFYPLLSKHPNTRQVGSCYRYHRQTTLELVLKVPNPTQAEKRRQRMAATQKGKTVGEHMKQNNPIWHPPGTTRGDLKSQFELPGFDHE